MTPIPCEFCRSGYHAPFDRFDCLGALTGPRLLQHCRLCETLWLEDLRAARRIGAVQARDLFEGVEIPMLECFEPENQTETEAVSQRVV